MYGVQNDIMEEDRWNRKKPQHISIMSKTVPIGWMKFSMQTTTIMRIMKITSHPEGSLHIKMDIMSMLPHYL